MPPVYGCPRPHCRLDWRLLPTLVQDWIQDASYPRECQWCIRHNAQFGEIPRLPHYGWFLHLRTVRAFYQNNILLIRPQWLYQQWNTNSTIIVIKVEELRQRSEVNKQIDDKLAANDSFNGKLKLIIEKITEMEKWNIDGRKSMNDLLNPPVPMEVHLTLY